MITFSPGEILEMAKQIERDGAMFYRKAAEQVADKSVGERLRRLAEMEDEHAKTFAEMAASLSTRERTESAFDPDGEEAYYLQTMVDGKVFDPRAAELQGLTGQETVEEVLCKAIQLEQESILFYLGLKNAITGDHSQKQIDTIIKEEMGHVSVLRKQLATVT